MIVVKVGGSLFDHPKLGPGLCAFVEALRADVLLVPGGGPVADVVRELDRVHGLGEEVAHWLALRALGVTGALLERLLPLTSPLEGEVGEALRAGWVSDNEAPSSLPPTRRVQSDAAISPSRGEVKDSSRVRVLDCFTFAREDESRPGALPHTWNVTTDSIAARAAVVFRAERLVLLKSTDIPPDTPWEAAAQSGLVDAHFPQVAQTLNCPIDVRNFRRELDARA